MSENNWNEKELKTKLGPEGSPERGGFILRDGRIIEFENVAKGEENHAYAPDYAVMLDHMKDAQATWHTHPGGTANLSAGDWQTFTNWPELKHLIVGTDGVRAYEVRNGAVVNA